MPILPDSVTHLVDKFWIAPQRWNTFNRYSQCFCSITPPKVGIYGAIGKYLSFHLSVAQMGLGIQAPFIIFSYLPQWEASAAQFNKGGKH